MHRVKKTLCFFCAKKCVKNHFDGVGIGVNSAPFLKSYISINCSSIKCLKNPVTMRVLRCVNFAVSEKIGTSTDGVGVGMFLGTK